MSLTKGSLWVQLAGRVRPVVAALLSRFWPGHDQAAAEARLAAMAPRSESLVTAAILLALFLSALFAAQFGFLGIGLYLLAVVLLVG
jgi:hypothetical protein